MKNRNIALLVVLLLVADQALKIWIKTHLALGESITVFPDWFFLSFIENPGAAFGFELGGNNGKLFLSLFRIVAIGGLCWLIPYLNRKTADKGLIVGFVLILAGAIGNMIDRIFRNGMVVDFLHATFINFPIFNVADCAVVIGAGLLILYYMLDIKNDLKKGKE